MPDRFSVAMCTFNGARHLREQLESIHTQQRLPDELVICDDGSSDNTCAIVQHFIGWSSVPVRFVSNEQNLGITKNFAQAISLCSGDLIALSDQDDIWDSAKLARLEAEFDRSPNVGLIFSDAELVDESGSSVGRTLWQALPVSLAERRRLGTARAIDQLLQGSIVTGATMAFRGRFKELVLPIPTNLSVIHDAWIALLISTVATVLPLPEPLIKYRQHSGQQIGALERQTAPPVTPLAPATIHKALKRSNPYSEVLDIAYALQRRLIEKQDAFDSREALMRLNARIAHLEARNRMPRSRLLRAPQVLRELITMRYHLYSNGMQSVIKDLLA